MTKKGGESFSVRLLFVIFPRLFYPFEKSLLAVGVLEHGHEIAGVGPVRRRRVGLVNRHEMFGVRDQGMPAIEIDHQRLRPVIRRPAPAPRKPRDRLTAADRRAGSGIDAQKIDRQRRIIEIESAGHLDRQRERVFRHPRVYDGMMSQIVVFEILLGRRHPQAILAIPAVGVVEPQQHLGPETVGAVHADIHRFALLHGSGHLRLDHRRNRRRQPQSPLDARSQQIAVHGKRPELLTARLQENRLDRIVALRRRDISLVAVGFDQHLAAASREAVEDDPLRGDEVRTDRVGHIDRQRVHIVEGDSDPVVEHLDHIVPHQPRPHEKAVIILRKARPHHSLVIHIVPLGGNGGGKGEAHFASRPVGRAQRLAERVGIGRHIPAAQMRRIVEISIRKGTSVDRGPRGRESRLLAVVLRQEQQQRLVVFQGRNFDARRRKIGPRPERQRDLGRYLPGFIAEGIEVFRRGGNRDCPAPRDSASPVSAS